MAPKGVEHIILEHKLLGVENVVCPPTPQRCLILLLGVFLVFFLLGLGELNGKQWVPG